MSNKITKLKIFKIKDELSGGGRGGGVEQSGAERGKNKKKLNYECKNNLPNFLEKG